MNLFVDERGKLLRLVTPGSVGTNSMDVNTVYSKTEFYKHYKPGSFVADPVLETGNGHKVCVSFRKLKLIKGNSTVVKVVYEGRIHFIAIDCGITGNHKKFNNIVNGILYRYPGCQLFFISGTDLYLKNMESVNFKCF